MPLILELQASIRFHSQLYYGDFIIDLTPACLSVK
jgi:hypothetical protein